MPRSTYLFTFLFKLLYVWIMFFNGCKVLARIFFDKLFLNVPQIGSLGQARVRSFSLKKFGKRRVQKNTSIA